ncbi:MAG: FIST C-terminal domain-containing protein, partial [Oscillospiraceae bacterium]|nr:FIST C-terminal domain-containing protein [Oscillospiraceae bacterium]
MKQFQFRYNGAAALGRELRKIRQWSRSRMTSAAVFQIFTAVVDPEQIRKICGRISEEIPEALYMGCSSNGNILEGTLESDNICITCTVFEYASTQVKMLQYPISDAKVDATMQALHEELEANPWVRAIELLVTIRGMSMTKFCDRLQTEREDIAVFGGGAFAADIDNNAAWVFSSAGPCTDNAVVFLLMGGDDLHVRTTHITGWKPLGKAFHVTRAEGSTLYELDGRAAYEAYYKYLNIKNNEHFFFNSLEFPFYLEHNGMKFVRAPIACNPDGSITMTSNIDENVTAHLAYGDPWTILNSVRVDGQVIRDYMPEVIHIYSCAARRTFWGDSDIGKESMPFEHIAPTSGFYTSSEF